MAADRDLLFGLLALQIGLIDQDALLAAFRDWTRDRATPLADRLVDRGDLDAEARSGVEAMVALHLKRHGGDAERSLASLPMGRSTRDRIEALKDPDLTATLARLGSGSTQPAGGTDATAAYAVGSATAEGQRFRVLRPYARGGLGAVFVALDRELHREVALKEILDRHADDPASRQRFLLEAEITGGLEHPGIVPVYGLGAHDDGRPYYAMRFIRGDSLKEAIERFHGDESLKTDPGRRSLELRKLLRRFLDVCNAIEYAHARGVLHRDIKPGNIIVGKHGETLVVDWGLARAKGTPEAAQPTEERPLVPSSASGSAETLPGSAIGTPAYMSPEQARGDLEALSPRSDVYSLGATLYALLTGKAPFEGNDLGAVLRAVQAGQFPRPRGSAPSIDRALEAVCLKAMARDPADRYPTARALADDVERWIADEPVSAFRDPITTRLTRWGRRHRSLASSIGVLLVTAVAALSVGATLINRERQKAEANFRLARAAVDDYFTTVSESRLLNVPGLQPLRKELLDQAARYYRTFLDERGADPSVRADAAAAAFRVGWINQATGRPTEAVEPLRRAIALAEQAARAEPNRPEHRYLAATAHGALGLILSKLERPAEAMDAHSAALAIREALAASEPNNPLYRAEVARTHRNIGGVHSSAGRTGESLASLEQAVAIGEALLREPIPEGKIAAYVGRDDLSAVIREDLASAHLDRATRLGDLARHDEADRAWRRSFELFDALARERPDIISLRERLASALIVGGLLLSNRGRLEEAADTFRKGLEIKTALAAENPSVTEFRSRLCEERISYGWMLKRLGRPEEAMDAYRRAIALAEGLVAERPDSASYRGSLSRGLGQMSNLLVETGRPAEAVPLARRALEIHEAVVRDQLEDDSLRGLRAYTLRAVGRAEAAAGNPAEARAAFARASEIESTFAEQYPGSRYDLGCTLALMVPVSDPDEREAVALHAVEALRRAIADGYSNAANLRLDPDLAALRDRPDYQALLAEVEARDAARDQTAPAD